MLQAVWQARSPLLFENGSRQMSLWCCEPHPLLAIIIDELIKGGAAGLLGHLVTVLAKRKAPMEAMKGGEGKFEGTTTLTPALPLRPGRTISPEEGIRLTVSSQPPLKSNPKRRYQSPPRGPRVEVYAAGSKWRCRSRELCEAS